MKAYFLTTEIIPFAETGKLAHFSRHIPVRFLEKGVDIRLTVPKYGFISERKYILREVIRLREIDCEYNGGIIKASAKSAFIPKTKVQIYFMEHNDWFRPLNPLLYKSKNGRSLSDNPDRYAFYGKTALNMLVNLFWMPDVIICNGWQAAFVPILYRRLYADLDFYRNVKVVQLIHDFDGNSVVPAATYAKLGTPVEPGSNGQMVNSLSIAMEYADLIVKVEDAGRKAEEHLSASAMIKNASAKWKSKLAEITLDASSPAGWTASGDQLLQLIQSRLG